MWRDGFDYFAVTCCVLSPDVVVETNRKKVAVCLCVFFRVGGEECIHVYLLWTPSTSSSPYCQTRPGSDHILCPSHPFMG